MLKWILTAQNINIDARFCMKIKATSFLTINAPCGMEILSNIIRGVSCASGRSASFLDFLGGLNGICI